MRRTRPAKESPASPRTARRRGTVRTVAGVLIFLFVALLCSALYLYVEITSCFEGRLWDFPSHVYSGSLVLGRGSPVVPAALVRRLERSGYSRVDGPPALPGQYRLRGDVLDVHCRSFDGLSGQVLAHRARILFSGDEVTDLEDPSGRSLSRLEIEPEPIALLSGPHQEEREIVRLRDVPERFVHAVLAAEDSRFFSHPGIDPIAVIRAALADLRSARIVQGGSTITQQTVKNLYLGQERTWWRKIREGLMAVVLDLRYSKERILEVYLNEVYLGQRGSVAVCGVATASRFYFGRDLRDLSVGESALLAGLIRSPGSTNPFAHPSESIARRDQVLDAMVDQGYLRREEAERAKAEPLRLARGQQGFARAPYVADFIRGQLSELYEPDVLVQQGLRIFTTLDTLLQEAAQDALVAGLERLEKTAPRVREQARQRTLEGAVIALDPKTGAVLAMVGGRSYRDSQFNRAVQARRQPGSCFKPFVYLAGFEAAIRGRQGGLTPGSVLDDEPLEIRSGARMWRPTNYDGEFRGRVSVREALEHSLNVPTVRAAMWVGLPNVVHGAERCGLADLKPLPSLALGAQEVSPLELATAYGVLANQGERATPFILREVRARDGKRLERRSIEKTRAASPQAAYLVTDVLQGVLVRGTAASAASLGFRGIAAGKTGTTDDTRDSWFVGFTPDLLVLVWVGYDDNARTGLTGASGALPIWVDVMSRAARWSYDSFREPDGIVRVEIDPESGMVARSGCPDRVEEVFASGTEPADECSLHGGGFGRWLKRLFGIRPKNEPR